MAQFFKVIVSFLFFISYVEGGMEKKVALVIAHEGYQPIEYCKTRQELETAGIFVVTVSDKEGTKVECFGEIEPEVISMTVKNFLNEDFNDFAGVFLIGGGGALDCLDNEDTYQLMRKVKEAGLYYGAICISPRILYHAGLINDKTITGWNGDGKLEKVCPDSNVVDKDVFVDGRLITGRDPHATEAFGQAIVNALK